MVRSQVESQVTSAFEGSHGVMTLVVAMELVTGGVVSIGRIRAFWSRGVQGRSVQGKVGW